MNGYMEETRVAARVELVDLASRPEVVAPWATQEQLRAIAAELAEFLAGYPDGAVPGRALAEKVVEIRWKYGAEAHCVLCRPE